ETQALIEDRFSSLGMTMMTLTQFVTVDSIASVYLPLIRQNPWLMFYFVPLILVVSISLMNLVTASLVEAALEHARQEKEEEKKLASVAAKNMLPDIVKLFDQLDADRSGFLVIQEMKDFETEGLVPPELLDKASVESMSELFQQLDVDESGRVNREEFIEGLLDIFLREVPVYSIQATKMLRLVRESQLKVEADIRSLQDQLGTKTERSLGFF
ncbi:CACNA1H, partial [Symbiodinium sp. CCMP2456]